MCCGKESECVHKISRFFLPVYAQLESVRVFLFSVGQKAGPFWGPSSGDVFCFVPPLKCLGFGWKGCLSLAARSGLPSWCGGRLIRNELD